MTRSKSDLRKSIRCARQAFVNDNKNIQDTFDHRLHHLSPLIDRCSTIGVYDRFGSEVNLASVITLAHAMGKTMALPFIAEGQTSMCYKRWKPGDQLCKPSLGFRQPAADAPDADPDLILVPLVGFDRDMNRLGQGGGYYDRYLSRNNNALKIGIAWSCQEVSTVPVDEWDIRLDAILTEKDWIVGANSVIAQ